MLVELRLEVDATSWLSVEVESNPLFSGALFGEEAEGDFSLADVVAFVLVGVVDVNLHVVGDEAGVDDHVLSLPLGVLATVLGNS